MNLAVQVDASGSLPCLVDRARAVLEGARSSAEVLEAREMASFAYDEAKRTARLQRAKKAHDELIAATHRTQADALEIEALAKRRLADEYDAAQDRGEVGKQGQRTDLVTDKNEVIPSAEDVGLTRKQIFEARQIRDAEQEAPGIVRATLDSLLANGEEPTRAAVTSAIVNRTSFTGNNQWFTPERYIDLARRVLGGIDLDPASHPIAQQKVCASSFFTEEDDGLTKEWRGRVWLNPPYSQPLIQEFVEKLVSEVISGGVTDAIMLTHNYTDTAWFQYAALHARAICFTRGRVRFESPSGQLASPTQGQSFFYFGKDIDLFASQFEEVGFVVSLL
jgi:phage N-6-adenine-methyltransferase